MAGVKTITPGDMRLALRLCSSDLGITINHDKLRVLSCRLSRLLNSWTKREPAKKDI